MSNVASRKNPPLVLVVLDGWGEGTRPEGNAILQARTPVYQELRDRYPSALLTTCGEAVGLPTGQMGNSEVGHMNLGAGRIVFQDLTRIDQAISRGELETNAALLTLIDSGAKGDRSLHLVGLLSDGGVHSHLRHLEALIRLAARRGVRRVLVHALTDGRDTAPSGGVEYLAALGRTCDEVGVGRVATVCGRYHAMDRDQRWDRTQRAYEAMTRGIGRRGTDAGILVEQAYARGITDEFIDPCVITDAEDDPVGLIRDDDAVIFFNYRADRARQLTRALAFEDFDGFARTAAPRVRVLTLTQYDATFGLPVAFSPQTFSGNLSDVLTAHNRTNLRLAETEKYAHVTYFFNCGEEQPARGEDRILVPSPTVPTYDLQPEMSAVGVTDHLVADLVARRHDVIICNFANADMVGHTGHLDAAVTAVETLDRSLGRIVAAVRSAGGTVIVTADHGNAEQMWDAERNGPHTAHTTNPVPVIYIGPDAKTGMPLSDGSLRDVAPTMLGVLGIEPSPEMTGRDLRRWLD
ncbi:MAG: phosphoglycerate mutase (2,3-diphosphoglycerate-independent) [Acidobacteria bacterium]|nr:phosphoglycerate mutase (2,3-diphosphoglycerate-independent) [Acidobacteriota bacterium]MDP7479551.1 2,3-bisphosphoglycerate-independent phosphoglycerate mutase [Vicinamibacterales bacterium]HJN42947.1 2,3-bisphosphoglycerate-independent phosphoglycerate mutase [Vicinamibacterales bacterium]